ncbi:MAG TPA: hypothetical protein VI755_11250 [Anaerolineales bacterium]|nr:hypothetical protein [Anaerolineales bacterium]
MEKKTDSPFWLFIFSLLALCLLIVYFTYCFIIPQTPARLTRPSASLVSDFPLWSWIVSVPLPIPNDPKSVAILLVATPVVAFAVYGSVVFLSRKLQARSSTLALVLIPTGAYLLLSTFALPNLNTDIFNYMLRGRLAAVHNKNPYRIAADEIPHDPVYPYASHDYTDIAEWWKLPMWTAIEIGLAKLTGEDVAENLFIYRVAFLLVNVSNLVLIAIIINKLYPHYLLSSLVLYAWNPIIVILGQSKGDTFIVFFLLLAILLLVFERRNFAIVPLTLSVLIKMTTLPFAAVYLLIDLRRKRWRDYIILGILFSLIAAIFYIQFDVGDYLATQLFSIIGMSGGSAPEFLRSLLRVVFVVLIIVVGLTRSGEIKQLILGWAILALFFSLFLIDYGKAWYLIPLIALACLIPDWRTTSMTYALSFLGFLIYTWNSGFNKVFSAPVVISLPKYIVYLVLPVVVLIVIGAVKFWKTLQQKKSGQVGEVPRLLSQQE